MKITCDSCGAKYTIADDKVSGRKVKIRCKGCGTPIVVDGAAKTAAGGTPDTGPARNDSTIPLEPALSSAPPASGKAEWSVNLSETDQRTMTTDELVSGWKSGSVTTDAFVWKEGMGDWVPILECAELTALLNAAPASPAAAAKQPAVRAASARPAAAAARTGGGRVQVGTDLFAGAAAAGEPEAEDLNTSAPFLPQGARGDDGKPTGARNENSVLFSLDALKAGFAGPPATKADPPKRAGATRGGPAADDPFGLGGGAVAASPMFSMADNAALLTAPLPPEPPKPVISYADPSMPAPARDSKKGLIIGVIAVLLVGGAGAAFALSAKKDKEEALAQVAAAAASAEKAREEERKARAAEEKARQEQKEASDKATAAAIAAAEAGNKPADDKNGDAKKDAASASAAAAAPGAKAGSAPVKKDDKKDAAAAAAAAAAAPAAGSDQPFNKAAAISSLGAAAGGAGSCKKLGGPTGSGKVTVTFANSGRVTAANVNGAPFAGTSVGGCVASIFRKAKVPPFTGSPMTVSKSFSIN